MDTDINYAFYRERYRGRLLDPSDFEEAAGRAESYVANITLGRCRRDQADCDAWRNAVCAVAEEMFRADNDGGDIVSETVGHHTVQYRGTSAPGGRLYGAASFALAQTNLLYRGF